MQLLAYFKKAGGMQMLPALLLALSCANPGSAADSIGGGCPPTAEKPKLVIAAYGDSTTQGMADDPKSSMPSQLGSLLCGKASVINEGVGGTSAEQLLKGTDGKHLPWKDEMEKSKADVILINHGINDTYRGTESLDAYRKTMTALVKIAKKSSKHVILQTPNPVYTSDIQQAPDEPVVTILPTVKGYLSFKRHQALQARVAVVKQIAIAERVPIVDANRIMLKLTQSIPLDEAYVGVHPRPVGYKAIAAEAAQVIQPMLVARYR